ncbi:MAG TPA: prenyltransferase, partial [Nitrospiria bacterium]
MTSVLTWLRAMRVQFLQASILPVMAGSGLAFREKAFSWALFWLIAAAIGAINIGTNLANDYFDHRSGADERNPRPTPFSGGSRVIQDRLLAPKAVLRASMIAYGVAILLGTALLIHTGWGLLVFG